MDPTYSNAESKTSKTLEGRGATFRLQGSVFPIFHFDLNCCTISCDISSEHIICISFFEPSRERRYSLVFFFFLFFLFFFLILFFDFVLDKSVLSYGLSLVSAFSQRCPVSLRGFSTLCVERTCALWSHVAQH